MIGVKVQRFFNLLQKDEIYEIHQASLEILEDVGVVFQDDDTLMLLDKGGAAVDRKSQIAKIPIHLVRNALKSVPSEYRVYNRAGDDYVNIGQGWIASRLTMSGINVVDSKTRERRPATRRDVEDAVKLVEGLENIHMTGPGCIPQDVDQRVSELYMWLAQFRLATKPLGSTYALTVESARAISKMAEAVYGGEDELKKKPRIRYYIFEPRSPLVYKSQDLNVVKEFVHHSFPVMIGPMPIAGLTAPITIGGALALHNAENLAGIVVTQLLKPGLPVSIAGGPCVSDVRTGRFLWAAPERVIMNCTYGQLARYYNIPSFVYAWHTESNTSDPQAAFEKTYLSFPAMIAGYNEAIGVGSLGSEAFSPQEAVLDNEFLGAIFRVAQGLNVNEETLAVDAIKRVGPGGIFLTDKHTLKHVRTEIRAFPSTSIFNTKRWELWQTEGSEMTFESADDKGRRIVSDYSAEPLQKSIEKDLTDIVRQAEKRLLKQE